MMLSPELMGQLALAILWINSFLIVAAALKQAAKMRFAAARLRAAAAGQLPGAVFARAKVVSGQPLAQYTIEQSGHCAAAGLSTAGGESSVSKKRAIIFHDRSRHSEVLGGSIQPEQSSGELTVAATENAEVWFGREAQETACQADAESTFESAYPDACRARGYVRNLNLPVSPGQEVWFFGEIQGESLCAPESGPLLLSTIDPLAFYRRKVSALCFFALATLVGAGVCTFISLYPPIFGPVSMIGAGLSLLFFLLIQPLGVVARDATLSPVARPLLGKWKPTLS